MHTSKKNKRVGIEKSIGDFIRKYGKAIAAFAAVAGYAYSIGFEHAILIKEREIMTIENKHSLDLLQLKEEYMEKYFQLREQLINFNENDTINENKKI